MKYLPWNMPMSQFQVINGWLCLSGGRNTYDFYYGYWLPIRRAS